VRVVLHPEADAEARSAVFWCEEQRPGLGDESLAEVSAVLRRIEFGLESFPRWPGIRETTEPVRMAVLRRFPYLVAFEVHQDFVLVLAIAHGKRRPLYWLARATGRPA
jgi:toxin ParE1/3/4